MSASITATRKAKHATPYMAINKKCECKACLSYRKVYMREYKLKNKNKEPVVATKIQITPQQIRNALIEVADCLGRPHYEVSVVREVVDSFRNDVAHPLKHLVVRELSLLAFSKERVL